MKRCLPILLSLVLLLAARAEDEPSPPKVKTVSAAEAFPTPAAVPVPPGPFDLQICFELAVLRSESLGMKDEDIRVAQARYWQAVGAVLPKVHLLTSERVQNRSSGGNNSGGGVIDTSSGDNGSSFFGGGGNRPDSFSSRINVKQPIFSGFREFNLGQAASADERARGHDKTRAYQLLYLDVSDVFYQILMYEGDLRILKQTQKTLEERIVELDRRVKLGKSRSGELLMAKADLADAKVAIEKAHGLLGASRELLSFLCGIPADAFHLKDAQPFPSAQILEAYLRGSGERPDVLAAIEEERSARKQLSAAKGEHWPTISAEGNYYLKQSPDNGLEWNVFLTCDLPIFEGGIIEAKVREQKSLVRSSQLNLEMLRRTADKDIRTAYNNFIASVATVLQLKEAVHISEANFQAQESDYKLGIVTNLDVLSAVKQMHDTRQKLHDAEMEARDNLVNLHVSAGQTPATPGATPDKSPLHPDASLPAPAPTNETDGD